MEKIFSIHIPKTAGTFFGQILQSINPEILFFNYGANSSDTRLFVDGSLEDPPKGECHQSFFFKLIQEREDGVSIMHGHVWENVFYTANPDAKLICWLREPAQRLFSHYEFFKRHAHPGNERYEKFKDENQSFIQFATDPLNVNRQIRVLDGVSIKKFSAIGIVEKIDQSLARFRDIINRNFTVDDSYSLNKNLKRRNEKYQINETELKVIKEKNQDDYNSYNGILDSFN